MSRKKRKSNPHHTSDQKVVVALSLRRKILFSALIVFVLFFGAEFLLRLARLGEPPEIGVLRFGYDAGIPLYDSDGIEREGEPFTDFPIFEADPNLFWRPIENTPFTGIDGLRLDAPQSKVKSEGVFRVGVIGDSCSFLGQDLYPNQFARLLEKTGKRVEVVNASCPGYTSEQGRRRLQLLWDWDVDLVVVYFGWNDHWKSLNGLTDRDLMNRQKISEEAQSWLGMSRLVWLLYSVRAKLTPPVPPDQSPVRVPIDDYRENLEAMLSDCQRNDCPVLCITAPSAFLPGQIPDWAFSFFGEIYRMNSDEVAAIPKIHERYHQVIRELCDARDIASLVDVAKSWSSSDQWDQLPLRFRSDRIHLTEIGHQHVADLCFEAYTALVTTD
ncbi:SGNH/GDSL hydrolase family protein [Rubripirellula sp.]|jgi:lysophospholipase L1-like esterase|nr:SGNH/GDSL hydrolase family protein [Rubripirellula sp.]